MTRKATVSASEWISAGGARDARDERADDPGEGRLADPAEPIEAQGDAELGGEKVGVEVAHHVARRPGAALAAPHAGLDLGRSHLDQSEFGGDEEAVDGDQDDRQHHSGPGAEIHDRGGAARSGRRLPDIEGTRSLSDGGSDGGVQPPSCASAWRAWRCRRRTCRAEPVARTKLRSAWRAVAR